LLKVGRFVVRPTFKPNHYHTVIYDRAGRYPEFVEHFHKLMAGKNPTERMWW
jgi:hypothetical protein